MPLRSGPARARWALSLVLALGAGSAVAAPPAEPAPKKKLPLLFARALGIVTSTVAQTEPQPLPRPATSGFALLPDPLVEAELAARHAEAPSIGARVDAVTRGFVGAPYLLSALGEGEGTAPDPDPRFRLDAFDCTTLVETALALAQTPDLEEAAALLDLVRYRGPPEFEHRRHLMTSQWIPGLVAEGWLEDITAELGGAKTRTLDLELTDERWSKRHIARALVLPDDVVPKGKFPLPYLTLQDALRLERSIPQGTVLNVVRADWPASPDAVTHQGIVVLHPGDPRRFVRHASPVSRRVIDEPLAQMLERYITRPRKWAVIGVNLLRVRE
ncbi:MAG: DUF1460 domain-containing protein [Myxococcales bacterium]|nr:DUF1460 domain-containing protein [Myxococcales bacterium]MCB9647461.1 DUF1460 domain-containing protein [Deltaproteobacteria bacterium]